MELISIHEFAYLVHRTVPQIRYLIEKGNSVSRLKAERRGKQYFIRKQYLYTFPFVQAGRHKFPLIYHYEDGKGLVICNECTMGEKCLLLDDNGYYINDPDRNKGDAK